MGERFILYLVFITTLICHVYSQGKFVSTVILDLVFFNLCCLFFSVNYTLSLHEIKLNLSLINRKYLLYFIIEQM